MISLEAHTGRGSMAQYKWWSVLHVTWASSPSSLRCSQSFKRHRQTADCMVTVRTVCGSSGGGRELCMCSSCFSTLICNFSIWQRHVTSSDQWARVRATMSSRGLLPWLWGHILEEEFILCHKMFLGSKFTWDRVRKQELSLCSCFP